MNPSATTPPEAATRTYLANLRHELRTPLNAIIGYSEMILEDADDVAPSVLEPLQQIRQNGSTLLNLVNTLLDASKITDGTPDAPIADLCQQMDRPLEEVLTQSQTLIADAPTLGIHRMVDDLQKIHEAGVRLLKELTELKQRGPHGTPTVSQPLKERASGMQDHVRFMRPSAAPARAEAIRGRVLVVDDIDMNRDVLLRRLQSQGHQVTLASSGADALALVAQQPFDLILLDILMPEMSGMEVLQRLKEGPWRNIPVVMISALDEMENVIRAIEIGAEDYLNKPFEPALLRARVGSCLEKKWLRDREVELLHNILPKEVVTELLATKKVKPRRFDNVAIMFSDIAGFTPYCNDRQPEEIVANLQELFLAFETFARAHSIEKIKTIGDSFMAACGLLESVENPVLECVRCGVLMIEAARKLPANWEVRIGVHCGSVVAGVLGHHKYLYDLWGDTVNTAARMESNGIPGRITLSEQAYRMVESTCDFESLGVTSIKGKGDMHRYAFRAMR